MTADLISDKLRPVFEKYCSSLAAVYLFGSTVTGEATQRSDLDIAVLIKSDTDIIDTSLRFKLFADISRILQRNDIDIVILNSSSNMILQDEIIRKGLVIFEADSETRDRYEEKILHCCIDFRYQRLMFMGV
jgi:predicted nucleotidyltransferase